MSAASDLTQASWQAFSRLLDEALELPPTERLAWLDALGPEHDGVKPALRAVLARASGVETAQWLATLPRDATPPPVDESDLQPGALVGPYRLIRELGVGGMGAVWLAERADGTLKRQVALKLPRASWSRGLAERMARERDILASLEHPNIARLYDAGTDAQGRPFLALEYVEGETIDAYASARQLPVLPRVELLLQVARAVAYAHSRLVVHRDLKPSNILVTADGQVRLLDFGIAKLVEGERAAETQLTQIAGRALTLDYASPEQIRGEPIGTASDVYSLGVVSYEILAGARPYKLRRGTSAELEQAIALIDAPLASTTATDASAKRALKGDLDAILNKALKKSPGERYATVDAMSQDICRYLAGHRVLARPDSITYRLSRFARRHRAPLILSGLTIAAFGVAIGFGATALVILALAVGLGIALWQVGVAKRERDRALRMVDRAEAVQSFLNTLLTDAARGGQPLNAEQLLRRSEQLVAQEMSEGPEVLAVVLSMIGTSMQTLGNSAEAIRLGEQALALTRNSDDPDLLDGLRANHALAIGWAGRYAEARQTLLGVVSRRGALLERRTEAHHYLAQLDGANNNPAEAIHHAEEALRSLRAQRHPPRKLEASMLMSLGSACSLVGRMAEAERHFAAAFARVQALGQGNTPHAVTLLNNWAVINERAGDARRSLQLVEQALALAGPDGVSPFLLLNRGRALENLGRFEEADSEYARGTELAAKRGMALPKTNGLLGQASVALTQGRLDAARIALAEADGAGAAKLPAHPQGIQRALIAGRLALAENDVIAAAAQFDSALRAAPEQATAVMAHLGRAEMSLRRGDTPAALASAEAAKALAIMLQGDKRVSFRTALASLMHARVLQAAGKAAMASGAAIEAEALLREAVEPAHPAMPEARRLTAVH
jgi:serine/threonine-protein kinase